MWLINIKLMRLEEFTPPDLPTYAILSHTWGDDEVTFQEFSNLALAQQRTGYTKIEKTCELATSKDIFYVWVDTCCIDKSSSAELSEAINSMFEWYRLAAVCFAHLSDLDENAGSPVLWRDEKNRHICRWFTRGWTLQELLAPAKLEFYDSAWNFRGLKTDKLVMRQLSSMTGIHNREVFENSNVIQDIPVGERMSWASRRQTKRPEDLAYCLLGIFQVNMPMIYGEGLKAFQRLQEEIMKASTDMSLFCWKAKPGGSWYRGLLAYSPLEFASYYDTSRLSRKSVSWSSIGLETEFAVTNKGIRIEAELSYVNSWRRTALRCNLPPDDYVVLIPIRLYRDDVYVREDPDRIFECETAEIEKKSIYISKHVGERVVKDLQKSMDLKLSFIISPIPAPFHLIPVKGWPTKQWDYNADHNLQLFSLTGAKINTCILVYQLKYEGLEVNEFAIICQKHSSAADSLRYAIVPMQEARHILEELEGSQKSDIESISKMEKFIIAERQTAEIESAISKSSLFISKYSPNEEQKENALYISFACSDDIILSKRSPGKGVTQEKPSEQLIKRAERLDDEGTSGEHNLGNN
ncbi:HET domain-containing protein [Xylaria venustula]|nr:HET domain-containing protein [Xylaria venustula]